MNTLLLLAIAFFNAPESIPSYQPLPALQDGTVVTGPGNFQQLAEVRIQGKVTLRHLTLDLRAPIILSEGATLLLEDVQLKVSDPTGTANGTSGLRCDGSAHLTVRNSSMTPSAGAHPIWMIKGTLAVDNFQTENSEFHLDHVQANLKKLKIFELEISRESQVVAEGLELVFLSTHSGDDEHLSFENLPSDKTFTRTINLGSGAKAALTDARVKIFLLYVHGATEATLAHMDRVQLAIFPACRGKFQLITGRLGEQARPATFPAGQTSDCPFHISLADVNVDTWDVYASGHAELEFTKSKIDELTADGDAKVLVEDSEVYADWMAATNRAEVTVKRSTVGALRLADSRPDLATSQVRLSGKSHAVFQHVRFDCGIVASDQATVEIEQSSMAPKYIRKLGSAVVRSAAALTSPDF